MVELCTLIATAPSFIQVLLLVLTLIGVYVVYKFKTIVAIVAGSALALWFSIKKGRK